MSDKTQTPSYYNTVMPYLILNDVVAFIEFTKTVFGAVEKMRHLDDNERVVHAEILIDDSTIMAGESTDKWKTQNAGLYINVKSADKTYQKALDTGASVVMELSNQDYGRTGGVLDPFGNTWWITSVD